MRTRKTAPSEAALTPACGACPLLHEADHRIANELTMLAAFLRLKTEGARKGEAPSVEDAFLLLESVGAQIEVLGRLHRSMVSARYDGDLGQHLHSVSAALVAILNGRVELVEEFADDCLVHPDQVVALTQIVAEAITNAIKYAYPEGRPGRILLRTRQGLAGASVVEVRDYGPGLRDDDAGMSGGGLGFRLIRALGKTLKAKIDLESDPSGLCIRVTLPPAPQGAAAR